MLVENKGRLFKNIRQTGPALPENASYT